MIEFINQIVSMSNHNYGCALLRNSVKQVNNFITHFGVNVTRRLIGNNDFRLVYKRSCKRNTLLLTARKFIRETSCFVRKCNEFKRMRHSLSDFRFLCAYNTHSESDIIKHRHLGNKAEILEHHTDTSSEFRNSLSFESGKMEIINPNIARCNIFFSHYEL